MLTSCLANLKMTGACISGRAGAKINKFWDSLLIEHDVGGLEIAMANVVVS